MILNLIVKRTGLLLSLVLLILWGCKEEAKEHLSLGLEDNRPAILIIPKNLVGDSISVRLEENGPDILGEFNEVSDFIEFKPAIPFTRGLRYKVFSDGKLVEEITIPFPDKKNAPEVLALYPSRDTVPENLLKVYIQFSQPMEEGESLKHLVLIRNGVDTIQNVFLDLEPELWSNDRMMLTLWLDPGRIKRDLQPNLKLGPPLRKGERYHLIIKDWRDYTGNTLKQDFQKDFVVGERDIFSPDLSRWNVSIPKPGTSDALKINLNDALDYGLLKNAVHIEGVPGTFSVENKETVLLFIPSSPWQKGEYKLNVESILEDNAGNNLNRLFDKDLVMPDSHSSKTFATRPFKVE